MTCSKIQRRYPITGIRNSSSHTALKLLSVVLVSLPISLNADTNIYRNLNSRGEVVYSSQASNPKQIPAKLPELIKAPLDSTLQPPISENNKTCKRRGGVDCSRTPEDTLEAKSDYVHCYDGTISEALSFSEICTKVSLKETLLVEFKSEPLRKPHSAVYKGLRAIDSRPIAAIVVEIRNLSAIPASIEKVFLKLPFLSPRKTKLEGATSIPAFGFAEYRVETEGLPKGTTPRHLAESKLQIRCSNCKGL